MDIIIDYNEAAGFLKNPHSLEPCPNFTNICTLHKHVIKALFQLFCPQSTIHGWSGLVMDPTTHLLLEGTLFVVPNDPRATAIYPQCPPPHYHQDDQRDVSPQQELLFVLVQEHHMGMLLHVRRKHCCPIQSVKHPISDGVEFNDGHHQDP
jgi:hypothetical protein